MLLFGQLRGTIRTGHDLSLQKVFIRQYPEERRIRETVVAQKTQLQCSQTTIYATLVGATPFSFLKLLLKAARSVKFRA
ncbi:hypothetical protein CLV24_104155 [Pontibacter ummariensis]|uniref:Uncharacterized protein n=1 Tax=Pontibacter ummariensis TaxID=1610492 RepID=A0A239DBQ1_9BACT|nr:hypothetical protein CLV24_104155 [Pontibacter ummariensis]SNS29740.1 hypothetical protein SAMN06296052_104154 [Pontibacter ummariensis]